MSYFSALARHTGVHIGGQQIGPARRIRPTAPIDVEATATATEPAGTTEPPRARAETRAQTPRREPIPSRPAEAAAPHDATGAHGDRDIAAADAPASAIRAVILETDGHASVVIATDVSREQPAGHVPALTGAAAPLQPPAQSIARESPEPALERRALPTLEDVRNWVAERPVEHVREARSEQPDRPAALSPARSVVPAVAVATADVEHFTLDIGSIEITTVAPSPVRDAAPTPTRVAQPAAPASAGRASRHYIRS